MAHERILICAGAPNTTLSLLKHHTFDCQRWFILTFIRRVTVLRQQGRIETLLADKVKQMTFQFAAEEKHVVTGLAQGAG